MIWGSTKVISISYVFCQFSEMFSPQNSVVERCIVDKVGIDGVVYEDGDRRVVLDQVQSQYSIYGHTQTHTLILILQRTFFHQFLYQELRNNGQPLSKKNSIWKSEHEFVKDVIKYGKRNVFAKMMDRYDRQLCSFPLVNEYSLATEWRKLWSRLSPQICHFFTHSA